MRSLRVKQQGPDDLGGARAHVGEGRQRSATVIAPALLGQGGLGRAAEDYVAGFEASGYEVRFSGSPNPPSYASRLAASRGLRRFRAIATAAARRDVLQSAPASDVVIAPPGFLPGGQARRILHQATWHPATVRDRLRKEQRKIGGGVGFLSGREAQRQQDEIERVDVIRVESRAVANDFAGRGVNRVLVSPPGVDLARFRPGRKPEQTTIAFIGTLSLWKGVHRVVALQQSLPIDVRLEVIGGPVCPWSKRLVERHALRRSADDVSDLLARAHFLILPSVTDGFGYVVLEAMAAGAVPIVTPGVGSAELVRRIDERLVVPDDEWPHAPLGLLQARERATWSAHGRQLAEEMDRMERAIATARAISDRLGISRALAPQSGSAPPKTG